MSETELKVGDTVKIKYHTESEKYDYPFVWSPIMDRYEGQVFIIREILQEATSFRHGCKMTAYLMGDNLNPFTWHQSSLIKIEKKRYQTF